MLTEVVNSVAKKLATVPFLSKAGGLVFPVKTDVAGTIKTLPVGQDFLNNGEMFWAIPDSSDSAISFFRANRASVKTELSTGYLMQAQVELLLWMNTEKLTTSCSSVSSAILSYLQNEIEGPYGTAAIKISYLGESAKSSAAIYGQYDLDEAQIQHLMPPYQMAAINLNLQYIILKDCYPVIEQINTIC